MVARAFGCAVARALQTDEVRLRPAARERAETRFAVAEEFAQPAKNTRFDDARRRGVAPGRAVLVECGGERIGPDGDGQRRRVKEPEIARAWDVHRVRYDVAPETVEDGGYILAFDRERLVEKFFKLSGRGLRADRGCVERARVVSDDISHYTSETFMLGGKCFCVGDGGMFRVGHRLCFIRDGEMTERKLSPREEFDKALATHADAFGVHLDEETRARLGDYFELVSAWNPRLHLVAPCAPTEFAKRHVLESLFALPFLDEDATLVDVGSGAGLPIIPLLAARTDLKAVLVEASQKKCVFLRETLSRLGRSAATKVIAERFERIEPPAADYLTCRALERFKEVLPALNEWASRVPTLLLFGGEGLRERLEAEELSFEAVLVPESERRFLFVVKRVASLW